MYLRILILIACTSPLIASAGHAQDWQGRVAAPAGAAAARPQPKAASASQPGRTAQTQPEAQPALPGQPLHTQTHYLIRTTLLALNDANRTGNYTVLRDLGAPSFRERNSAADLAHIFSEMRRAKLDLGIAALLPPEIDGAPLLDANRRLHLKGFYATEPNRLLFELQYEAVGGIWLLHGVSVSTAPSRTAAKAADIDRIR